ncbi:MAG: SpoIIE family protein phosphatase [Desulfobacterales bacterium]|nr:SpoIIE family protein phosphatase [Desulfobacterales bacterium]
MQSLLKIFEKFHEPPERVPGKQIRFFVLINYAFLIAGLFHFAFIWIFALFDLYILSIFNIFSSALWATCIYLNLQGRRFVHILLANAEVLTHAGLCVAILGWHSGFHYYVLAVPLLIFLSPWKFRHKIAIYLLNYLTYALLYHFADPYPAATDSVPTHVYVFNYFNMAAVFFCIASFAFYYRRAVFAVEAKLEIAHQRTTNALLRLNENLANAAVYVKTILPAPIQDGPVRSHWGFIPSESLGGDAFGYNWLDEDHFAIYLLDVSGHGVSAALLSATIMNVLRATSLAAVDFREPDQVLSALNRTFPSEENNDMFFTIWYGVYNKQTRNLAYASGGHPPAILLRQSSRREGQSYRLGTRNHIVGGLRDSAFRKKTQFIDKASFLYVFSDGVYEFLHPNGNRWRYDEFIRYLDDFHSGSDSDFEKLVGSIKKLNRAEVFEDDFTLLRVSIN